MPNPIRDRRLIFPRVRQFDARNYGAGTLYGWWSADRLSLNDGDAVSTWLDQSGRGNNATQSGGNRPVYKANIQGNKPGVLFTKASSQSLNANGLAAVVNGTDLPYTIILAIKGVQLAAAQVFAAWGNSASSNGQVWFYTSSSQYNTLRKDDAATSLTTATGTIYTLTPQVISHTYTGTIAAVYVNGAAVTAPIARDVGAMTIDRFAMGTIAGASGPGSSYDGYMFEVLVYASALGDYRRQRIERALGQKWAIPIP